MPAARGASPGRSALPTDSLAGAYFKLLPSQTYSFPPGIHESVPLTLVVVFVTPVLFVPSMVACVFSCVLNVIQLDPSTAIAGNYRVEDLRSAVQVFLTVAIAWVLTRTITFAMVYSFFASHAVAFCKQITNFKRHLPLLTMLVIYIAFNAQFQSLLYQPLQKHDGMCAKAEYQCMENPSRTSRASTVTCKNFPKENFNSEIMKESTHVQFGSDNRTITVQIPADYYKKQESSSCKLSDDDNLAILARGCQNSWEMAKLLFYDQNVPIESWQVRVKYVPIDISKLPNWKEHESIARDLGNSQIKSRVQIWDEEKGGYKNKEAREFFRDTQDITEEKKSFKLSRGVRVTEEDTTWSYDIGTPESPRHVLVQSKGVFRPRNLQPQDYIESIGGDDKIDIEDYGSACDRFWNLDKNSDLCKDSIIPILEQFPCLGKDHKFARIENVLKVIFPAKCIQNDANVVIYIILLVGLFLVYDAYQKLQAYQAAKDFAPEPLSGNILCYFMLKHVMTEDTLRNVPLWKLLVRCSGENVLWWASFAAWVFMEVVFSSNDTLQMTVPAVRYVLCVLSYGILRHLSINDTAGQLTDMILIELMSNGIGVILYTISTSVKLQIPVNVWYHRVYTRCNFFTHLCSLLSWFAITCGLGQWLYMAYKSQVQMNDPYMCIVVMMRMVLYASLEASKHEPYTVAHVYMGNLCKHPFFEKMEGWILEQWRKIYDDKSKVSPTSTSPSKTYWYHHASEISAVFCAVTVAGLVAYIIYQDALTQFFSNWNVLVNLLSMPLLYFAVHAYAQFGNNIFWLFLPSMAVSLVGCVLYFGNKTIHQTAGPTACGLSSTDLADEMQTFVHSFACLVYCTCAHGLHLCSMGLRSVGYLNKRKYALLPYL